MLVKYKMDFNKIEKMVAKYNGPKVGFVVSGGGASVANLALIPGVSKLLHEVKIPYSLEATESFISSIWESDRGRYSNNAVSKESAFLLANAAKSYWGGDVGIIGCTAAITTSRWRRGDNHAWICVIKPNAPDGAEGINRMADGKTEYFHLELSKLSEKDYANAGGYVSWKRRDEDQQIADFLLEKAFSTFGR